MSRGGFAAVVAAVVVIAFAATWLISAQPGAAAHASAQTSSAPAASAPAARALLPAPIAEASTGQIQCYGPNVEQRTCQGLETYTKGANGEIEDSEQILIGVSPTVVMHTVFPVTIKAGQLCEGMARQEFETADFTIDGAPAGADVTARLHRTVLAEMRGYLDHQECSAFISQGGSSWATTTLGGAKPRTASMKVMWVSPADGYTVER